MRRIIFAGIIIFLGIITGLPGPSENHKGNAHGFCKRDSIREDNTAGIIEGDEAVLYLEEVQETAINPGIDQFFNDINTTEQSEDRDNQKWSDTQRRNAQQETIKIRTELKCVELILKRAVIESYYLNGQIKGLRLNCLDEIPEAKALLLKSGDIILAVNGEALSSKKNAYDIFMKTRHEPILTVDLLRDGKAKKLLFNFQ